jgi:hypothetical protein
MKREEEILKNDGGLYRGINMTVRTADIIIAVLLTALVLAVVLAVKI